LVVGDEQAYFIIEGKKEEEILDVFLYREDGSLHQPEYILGFA